MRMSSIELHRRALLTGSAALVVLAACGPGGGAQQNAGASGNGPVRQAGPTELNFGNAAEPKSLDPAIAQGTYEDQIISDILMGLMVQTADGKPIGGAAERWEVSEDGLTWTFHLRDHQWSDGQPVTAEDFVYSWRRILNPKTASTYAYFLYPMKNAEPVNAGKMPLTALGASAPDAKTVVVQLEHPAPYLLEFMCHHTTYPVPRHVIEAKGDQWAKPGNHVGNGAFILAEWVPNDHITLTKNPRFYDAANVKLTKLTYFPSTDYDAALRRLRAGELDYQDRLPTQQIDWIRANMPEVLHLTPIMTTEYLAVNHKRKPLDDGRVREALALALDRETIVNTIRKIGEPPAYGLVPPGIANYPGGQAMAFKDMPFPQRLERAKELMRQAGYGPDKHLRTTLATRVSSAEGRRVPAAVQNMWLQIYVDTEIVQTDTAVFYDKVQEHDFDIALAGWQGDFNDALTFLDILRTGNSNNYGQYSNLAYDALLDQANQERDVEKRGELLAQAEGIALKDIAFIPEFFWVWNCMMRPYVKGVLPNIADKHRGRWMSIAPTAA
jgi:oligopeptide transport system substrate-binding protein